MDYIRLSCLKEIKITSIFHFDLLSIEFCKLTFPNNALVNLFKSRVKGEQ